MISEKKKEPSTHLKAPKAVDEDLYKIPPELLHKMSKHVLVLISIINLFSWVSGFDGMLLFYLMFFVLHLLILLFLFQKRLQIRSWVECLGMSCMPCCP